MPRSRRSPDEEEERIIEAAVNADNTRPRDADMAYTMVKDNSRDRQLPEEDDEDEVIVVRRKKSNNQSSNRPSSRSKRPPSNERRRPDTTDYDHRSRQDIVNKGMYRAEEGDDGDLHLVIRRNRKDKKPEPPKPEPKCAICESMAKDPHQHHHHGHHHHPVMPVYHHHYAPPNGTYYPSGGQHDGQPMSQSYADYRRSDEKNRHVDPAPRRAHSPPARADHHDRGHQPVQHVQCTDRNCDICRHAGKENDNKYMIDDKARHADPHQRRTRSPPSKPERRQQVIHHRAAPAPVKHVQCTDKKCNICNKTTNKEDELDEYKMYYKKQMHNEQQQKPEKPKARETSPPVDPKPRNGRDKQRYDPAPPQNVTVVVEISGSEGEEDAERSPRHHRRSSGSRGGGGSRHRRR